MTAKWDSVDYHKHSYPQYAFALGLLQRLGLNGDERILDIGCGDGKVTATLAMRVPRGSVLGIDASPDMITFARTTFPTSAYPNLSFRYGDAANLTFRHEFDIVVAFASLHWVKDLQTALRGIKQSLASGGRFAAQLVAKRYASAEIRSPLHRAKKEVMDGPAWRPYFEGFEQGKAHSANECEQLVRDAGFVLRRCEFVSQEVMHQDADALKGYARSTWHRYTDQIPVQKRDAFLNEVVQRCIEMSPADRSGRIHVCASVLEVDATVAGT
ncbi:MAG: class I SAM-dependent methyltransferase [Halobacteriota archaeon]